MAYVEPITKNKNIIENRPQSTNPFVRPSSQQLPKSGIPTSTSVATGTVTINGTTYTKYTDLKTGNTFITPSTPPSSSGGGGGGSSGGRSSRFDEQPNNTIAPTPKPKDIISSGQNSVRKAQKEMQLSIEAQKKIASTLTYIQKQKNAYDLMNNPLSTQEDDSYYAGEGPRLKSEGKSSREIIQQGTYDTTGEIINTGLAEYNEQSLFNELKHTNTIDKINRQSEKYIADLQDKYNKGQLSYDDTVRMQDEYYAQLEQKIGQANEAYVAQQRYLADKYRFDATQKIEQHQQEMREFGLLTTTALSFGIGAGMGAGISFITRVGGQTVGKIAGGTMGIGLTGLALNQVASEAPATLYQASIGNYRPLVTMVGENAAAFYAGGKGFKLAGPQLKYTSVIINKKRVEVTARIKDVSVGTAKNIGVDEFGNNRWLVTATAKVELVDANGRVVKTFKDGAIAEVTSKENPRGIIESELTAAGVSVQSSGRGSARRGKGGRILTQGDVTAVEGNFITMRSDEGFIVNTNKESELIFGGVMASRSAGKVKGEQELFQTKSSGIDETGIFNRIREPEVKTSRTQAEVQPKSLTTITGKIRQLGETPEGNLIFGTSSASGTMKMTFKSKGYRRIPKTIRPFKAIQNVRGSEKPYRKPQNVEVSRSMSFVEALAGKSEEQGYTSFGPKSSQKKVTSFADLVSKSLATDTAKTTLSISAKNLAENKAPTKTTKKTKTEVRPMKGFGFVPSNYEGKGSYEQSVTFNDIVNIPLSKSYVKPVDGGKESKGFEISLTGSDRFGEGSGGLTTLGFNQDEKPDLSLTGSPILTGSTRGGSRGRDRGSQISNLGLDTKQDQTQGQKIDLGYKQKSPTITPFPNIIPRIPRTPTTKTPIIPRTPQPPRKDKYARSEFGFIPYAKVGKTEKALTSRPVSKSRALSIGSQFTDTTLAKSFRIQPTRTQVKSERIESPNLYKFRTYQQKRGKKINTPFTYYEKRKFALEPGEQRTIRPLKVAGIKRAASTRRSSLGLF